MQKTLKITLVFVLLLTALGLARVETNDLGISIWFPDDWSVEIEDDDMRLINPSGTAVVLITIAEPADLETSMLEVAEVTEEWVHDSATTEENAVNINGLEGYCASGTGTMEGQSAGWTIGALNYKGKHIVMATMAVSSLWDDEEADIHKIPLSIKPSDS